MEEYAKILLFVTPIFLILIGLEKLYAYFKGEKTVPGMDSVSSISAGLINSVRDVLGISFVVISYEFMVSKLSFFQLETTILTYILAFLAIDFHGYWSHRWAHKINFLWNKHAIHHSSEEFDLACALRQPISNFVKLYTFLLFPAAIIGIPANIIAITFPIQFVMQFWYHTRHINKLGFLEKILVTPSHHRVHHAINPEYMDKNFAQIFIFWDKLFGSFQEELESVPAVYGITRPVQTWNPIFINFQHLGLLISDAWRAETWKDKWVIWFKPTGWRPENFEEKYPVKKIKNVFDFEKYNPKHPKKLMYWSVFQVIITFLFVYYFFYSIAIIGIPNIFIYSAFIFVNVFSYTELMDVKKTALFWEVLKFIFGILIIYFIGNWFKMDLLFPFATPIVIGYLLFSLMVTTYFVATDFEKNKLISS